MRRRHALLALTAIGMQRAAWPVTADELHFPRDHGSHPTFATEWWYLTGQVQAEGALWGFQITFFRSRVDIAATMHSAFAARQLLFAHAALTDLRGRRLLHDQRIAREGFGVARASEQDTAIRLQDWSLTRENAPVPGHSRYLIEAAAQGFSLQLQATSTQPVLLQGEHGLSRKGPEPAQSSWYTSQPQLAVPGHITLGNKRMPVQAGQPWDNRAWMDHEWSEALMHPDAVGWDWIGMNLRDGGALTAFVLRRLDGSALWAGGSFRPSASAPAQVFGADDVRFTPQRLWTSAASGARYPVQWQIDTPAGRSGVHALLDDQELDSGASTGAIYWEGLSVLRDAGGEEIGRGYLEMTGYARPLRLR